MYFIYLSSILFCSIVIGGSAIILGLVVISNSFSFTSSRILLNIPAKASSINHWIAGFLKWLEHDLKKILIILLVGRGARGKGCEASVEHVSTFFKLVGKSFKIREYWIGGLRL